jgi:cytochrome c biogenesis protein CcdA
MSAKKILTAVLLLFLAVNLGALAAKHLRHDRESSDFSAVDKIASETGEKVVVYYFHARERCDFCRNIETNSKEAVQSGFEKQLAEGSLAWRVVDFDEPANRHFDKDYALGGIPSVVFVKMKNGKSLACEVLPAVWGSITSDTKAEFIEYIQKEIRGFMQEFGGNPTSTWVRGNENKPQSFAWGLLWALWLGIFTAITPCTLVSNIAAVSYIGRQVDSPRRIIATGVLYAVGQTLAYTVLGFVLVAGLLASSMVSSFLHRYMNELLGPLLVLTAMFLLGLIDVGISGPGVSERLQKRVDALGIWGAFFLGVLFALSFCPVSGGLFFLQLIPQAAYLDSPLGLPALYGFGNALPVVVFAFLFAISAQSLGKAFNRLTQIERWLRWLTGVIFLAVGIFFTLRYIFDLRMIIP